ncbi:MAG: alpha/beta hydrolase [Halobacteria archaeon]|nr:alpha/beta hydrolase [Halobacteria archaeon]
MPEVETNGVSTYYEVTGDRGAETIVFVHGGWLNHEQWAKQVESFSSDYHVLTYDIRGHGKTQGSRDSYSVELFTDDLRDLLERLPIDRPYICGSSLGGMVAQRYALEYPGGVEGLILANTPVSFSITPGNTLEKHAFFSKPSVITGVRLMGVEAYTEWIVSVSRAIGWFCTREVRDYVRGRMKEFTPHEYIKVFSTIHDFGPLNLSGVGTPTLVLNGGYEPEAMKRHGEAINKMIEDSKHVVIPRSGHLTNIERPLEFNERLERFIREVGA